MNAQPASLAELTELPVEIDPRIWRRRTRAIEVITGALENVGSIYATHAMLKSSERVRSRVARKLLDALKFFKRSYRPSDDLTYEIVNLAVAFEVLLTDNYSRGISDKLKHRASLAIGTVRGKRRLLDALGRLYDARGECVHTGRATVDVDIRGARRAFTCAFLGVSQRLNRLPNHSSQPIGDILGDRR